MAAFFKSRTSLVCTLLTVVVIGLNWGFFGSEYGRSVEYDVARSIDFSVRSMLGREPQLDPRLKLFAFEDTALISSSSNDYDMEVWLDLIHTFQEKADLVWFTKMFQFPKFSSTDPDYIERKIYPKIRGVQSNTVAAAFTLAGGSLVKYGHPYTQVPYTSEALTNIEAAPGWMPVGHKHLMGPNRIVRDLFKAIGHGDQIVQGQFRPFLKTQVPTDGKHSRDAEAFREVVLPHLGLAGFRELNVDADGFDLAGRHLTPNRRGALYVNFPSPRAMHQRLTNLAWVVSKIKKGEVEKLQLEDGDVIGILGRSYTGGANIQSTSVGRLMSDLINVAILNSALTGQWLTEFDYFELVIIIFGLLGAVIGFRLVSLQFTLATLVGGLVVVGIGQILFSYQSTIFPWFPGVCSYVLCSTAVFVYRSRERENYVNRLRDSLQGMVADDNLKAILRNPKHIDLNVTENVVTTMFIDVVEFSEFANEVEPSEVFANLKELFTRIGTLVHKYGGIVDKSLGDGVLCYFGYNFDGSVKPDNHAEKAIRCAIEVQESQLQKIGSHADPEAGNLVHPLRIGINTGNVYIGDLGTSGKIEITLIGQSVNMAQRMEAACEPFKIMMGPATRDMLGDEFTDTDAVNKRLVTIKHQKNVITAFEWNPFLKKNRKAGEAIDIFRKSRGIKRQMLRWPVNPRGYVTAKTEHGLGVVIDFSKHGLSVELPVFLAKNVRFSMVIDDQSGQLRRQFYDLGLVPVLAEVRWGRKSAGGYVHGISIQNLNDEQRGLLCFELRQLLGRVSKELSEAEHKIAS